MSDVLSDREAVIFYAEQRGYASAMEAERKLHEAHIEAQAAEIERLRGAMQEAIRLAEQPHYGDRGDALDHCFDAIDVLRETLAELTGDKT